MSVFIAPEDPIERQLRDARTELERAIRAGEEVGAEQVLQRSPELAAHPDLALELVLSEFVTRESLGLKPDPAEWYERFPQWADRLRRLFQINALLGESEADPLDDLPADPHLSESWSSGTNGNGDTERTDRTAAPEGRNKSTRRTRTIGDFDLGEELGRGGMGIVYRALQRKLGRPVALKLLRTGPFAGEEELRRMEAEAHAVGRLRHPNIVQIYDFGEVDEQLYLALELIDGGSLDERIRGRPLPINEAVQLTAVVAQAVQFAHDRGIVHRDLKPANILLANASLKVADDTDPIEPRTRTVESAPPVLGTPKITDFGLAKQMERLTEMTVSGQPLGTLCYMAPEQAAGRDGRDRPAVDIWAIGAILYESLTGRPPFTAESTVELQRQIAEDDPIPPRVLRRAVPIDLQTVCLKCLQKDPHRRYAGASEVAADLQRFQRGEPIAARPVGRLTRIARRIRRRPWQSLLAGSFGISIILLIVGWITFTLEVRDQRDQARNNDRRATAAGIRASAAADQARIEQGRAEEQAVKARRQVMTSTLLHASEIVRYDAERASALLDGEETAPREHRGFPWQLFRRYAADLVVRSYPLDFDPMSLKWLGDGSGLVMTTIRGDLRVWDLASESVRTAVPRDTGVLSPAAVSSGSGVIAWAHPSGRVYVVDPDGRLLSVIEASAGRVVAIAVNSDGSLIATADPLHVIHVRRASDGTTVRTLSGHSGLIQSIAFCDADDELISGGNDAAVRVWNLKNGECRATWKLPQPVGTLSPSPEGRPAVVGLQGGFAGTIDLNTGRFERIVAHRSPIHAASLRRSSDMLVVTSRDGQVDVVDTRTKELIRSIPDRGDFVTGAAFSPDGRFLAVALQRRETKRECGRLLVWEVGATMHQPLPQTAGRFVACMGIDATGIYLCVGHSGSDRDPRTYEIQLLDLNGGTESGRLTGHRGRVTAIIPGHDERTLITVGLDSQLLQWDVPTRTVSRRTVVPGGLSGVVLDADDQIWVSTVSGMIHGVSRKNGRPSDGFSAEIGPVSCLVRHPATGAVAAVGGPRTGGAIRLWPDSPTMAEAGRLLTGGVSPFLVGAFSPDGSVLAAGARDGSIRLWNATTGAEMGCWVGHVGEVRGLAFTPDGRTLASCSADTTVRLWSVAQGREQAVLRGHTNWVNSLIFHPDGSALFSGGISSSGAPVSQLFRWQTQPLRNVRGNTGGLQTLP